MLAATPAVQCCCVLLLHLLQLHLASNYYYKISSYGVEQICVSIALLASRCHRLVSGIGLFPTGHFQAGRRRPCLITDSESEHSLVLKYHFHFSAGGRRPRLIKGSGLRATNIPI